MDRPGSKRQIGDYSLQALRDQYRYDLLEDYVPFWNAHGIDRELGGFICALDHDGTQVHTHKPIRYQGRGLWVHSKLYNDFGDVGQLETLRRTYAFVLRHGRDATDNWYTLLDRQGSPLGGTDPIGLDGLFMAEGLMEYARATGDREALDLAVESVYKAMELYDDPQRDAPLGYVPLSYPGMRIQGFEMVTVAVLSQLVQRVADPTLEARLGHAVDVLLHRFYHPGSGLNSEILSFDYSRPRDANERFFYLGHGIEVCWILLQEALRRDDRAMFDKVAARLRHALEQAWDDEHGGFCRAMQVGGSRVFDKVLWLQEEVLIGTMILLEHSELDWPEAWFVRTFDYVQDKFPLRKHGYPMWQLIGDRQVTFQPNASRKGNYHHPRHLMLNLLALDRMIERASRC